MAARGALAPIDFGLPEAKAEATLPRGFVAGSASMGIKASGGLDVAIVAVAADIADASVAAVFTTNLVPAAPVTLSQRHLRATAGLGGGRYGWTRAILSTAGCANAASGPAGMADQERLARALGRAFGTAPERTLALSTGLIGTRLPADRLAPEVARLARDGLSDGPETLAQAAEAIRTTDSRAKQASVHLVLPDAQGRPMPIVVSGIAKGVGMIHPRMATMLAIVLTDASVAPQVLHPILQRVAARTWDQLTVDGDTSTNDTVFLVASGAAGAALVLPGTPEAEALEAAVDSVARSLARQQAADGEGATTLITCQASGAADDAEARAVARAVVGSSLVKAAVHGRDPNWGRIVGAAGNARLADGVVLEAGGMGVDEAGRRSGAQVRLDPAKLRVALCGTEVFRGSPVAFDRGAVRAQMDAPEILIRLDLGLGNGRGEAFGCDLTEAYVIENSEYST